MAKQDEVSAIKELISQGFDQIIAQQQSLAQGVDNVLMLIFTRKAPDAFDYIDHENPSNSILKTLVAQNIGSLLLDRIKTLKQMCEEQVVYYKKQWEIINSCELGDELNLLNKLMEEHKNWSILTFGAKLDNVAVEIENECREIFPHFFQPQENIVVYSKAQLKQFAEGIQLPKLEIPKIKIGASKLVLTKTPNVNVALEQHALGKEMKELLETVKSYDEKVPSLIAKNLQAKLPLAFYPFGQVADLQFLKPKLKKISHIFTEATSVTNLCQEHHNNLKTKLFPLILMHQGKEASALWKAVTESHITWKEQLATSISHIVDHMQASITSAYPNGDYDTDDTLILDSIKDLNDELPTIGDPGDDQ